MESFLGGSEMRCTMSAFTLTRGPYIPWSDFTTIAHSLWVPEAKRALLAASVRCCNLVDGSESFKVQELSACGVSTMNERDIESEPRAPVCLRAVTTTNKAQATCISIVCISACLLLQCGSVWRLARTNCSSFSFE